MKLRENIKKISRNNIHGITSKIKKIIDEIYSDEVKYNKKIINVYKILVASSKKFLHDDCFTKASSIAYTTLISLIPTLTVVLTFYSIFQKVGDKKEEAFNRITIFMLEHNIKINIDPILESISSLIENAGKIGGIGAVLLIFSATAVLRTLDKALNDIWKIKKGRTIFLKIIYFWAALSLGPILIISGSTLANQIESAVSSTNYYSADFSAEGKIWAVGNKADIIYSDIADDKFTQLPVSKIDFDNQEVYHYDEGNKTFVKQEYKIEEIEFIKAEWKDIQFFHDLGWIVGKNGMLLLTKNSGISWDLKKIASFGFNAIHMTNRNKGFIIADNGYLLFTDDGWQNWELREWKGITENLRSIAINGKNGIITGDRGLIITTNDEGETWKYANIPESKIKKKYTNINSAFMINEKQIVLTCDEGLILFSNDSGNTWEKKKFSDENYYASYFFDDQKGFIAGEKGILLSTDNGGQNWYKRDLSIRSIHSIKHKNGILWAFGDSGMIIKSMNGGNTWQGEKGKSFILYLTNFLAPLLYIWLLFLLIYIFFPNTKIPFKAAAIGAAFTGIIWVIFIQLFEFYVKLFSKGTLAIYGALAAIPIFLLMVYSSFLIVLYGAEVSYTLMYPHTYLNLKKISKDRKDIHLYYGIFILYTVYKKFESGNGSTMIKELLKTARGSGDEFYYFIELFKKENLISESESGFSPANSSRNINLGDIITLIHDVALYVPGPVSSRDKLKKIIEDIFNKIKNSKENIIKDISLADLIERAG